MSEKSYHDAQWAIYRDRILKLIGRHTVDLKKTTGALPVNQVPAGIPGTRLAPGSVTPAQLSFDPATQTELDAEAATRAAADSAQSAPSYLTLALSGTLANERRVVAGANITLTDSGAGADLTIAASGGGAPSGPAGGVLSGTYPNPGFASDMATQAELDAEATARAVADTTHAALTTAAHGGIVASSDVRLTDSRTPLAHAHPESDVTNLVGDLALKAPLASPALTGVPVAPTAAALTNTTQLATTAFATSADATHAALTTTAHGGIVASADSRLTDSRTPVAHDIGGALHTGTLTDALHGARAGGTLHANAVAAGAAGFLSGTDKTKLDGIAAGAQVGTVTSVALTAPSMLTVAGSPITGAGALALTFATQPANRVLVGPASGAAQVPTFRVLVNDDIPTGLDMGKFTTGQLPLLLGGTGTSMSASGGANQVVRQNSVGGAFTVSALANADMPAQAISSGATFPGSPATNDLRFRTDRGLLYYYDGARWLTMHEYEMDLALYQRNAQPYAGAGATIIIAPARTDYGVVLTRAKLYLDVIGTNNGTNYWTISVAYCGTVVWSPSTIADAGSAAINKETALTNVITSPTGYAGVDVAKVGAPSAIALNGTLWYRLIG